MTAQEEQVARTAVQEEVGAAIAQVVGEAVTGPSVTTVAYAADGETYDAPVDTRTDTQSGLPGVSPDQPVEMFDGRQVTAWKYSLTGNVAVNRMNEAASELFASMRADRPVTLLVTVEPGSVAFKPNTEDGHIVGFTRERKLHVTEVWAADTDASELFDGGLMRVRRTGDEEDDGIGYLTEEPDEIPDGDPSPLAESLAEAMPVEPGMCGMKHPGHLNQCRQPAHSCPLRGN